MRRICIVSFSSDALTARAIFDPFPVDNSNINFWNSCNIRHVYVIINYFTYEYDNNWKSDKKYQQKLKMIMSYDNN